VPHHSPSTPKIGGLSVRNHPSMCNCVVLLANEKCFWPYSGHDAIFGWRNRLTK
jgi:hypothetical protein